MTVAALLTFAMFCLGWCIQRELGEIVTALLWLHYNAWLDDIDAMHETLDRIIILENREIFRLEKLAWPTL